MRFVRVDDLTLHAQRDGEVGATPLVFVNALGTDLRVWTRLSRYLSDRFYLVRYDQRGHGLSAVGMPPYTIDQLAADLAGVMDQLDTGPAVLCGLSLGGMVALQAAANRPDLVRGLVLMGTATRIGTPATWQVRHAAVEAGGIDAVAGQVLERWFPEAFRRAHPEEVEGWRAMLTRTPTAGYLACLRLLQHADLDAVVGQIKAPAVCISGEHDEVTPTAAVDALAARLPGATSTLIHDAGHLPCIDQPAAVAAAMLAFLEANDLG